MGIVAADYLNSLRSLLPFGPAWEIDGTDAEQLLNSWAIEFGNVQARTDALIEEADPRTTAELLTDYERIFGLPDPCVTIEQSIDQRRFALASKMAAIGGQSRATFISIAESMGYAGAEIEEYFLMTCVSNCDDFLNSISDLFTWTISLPFSTGGLFLMDCNSVCTDSLQSWGDEAIECRINKYKPAHTTVIFAYP